jgi:3-oxoacyl-[acyl-carrier protein] reductase
VDPIQAVVASPLGRSALRRAGVAPPPELRRYVPGDPLLVGPALVGTAGSGRDGPLAAPARALLAAAGAEVRAEGDPPAAAYGALVLDVAGVTDVDGLAALHAFFAPTVRSLAPNGRVLVLGRPPEPGTPAAVARHALPGFVRSLAKELRGGATANLVLVDPGAEGHLDSTVRFLASARSAFVDGQPVRLRVPVGPPARAAAQPARPLAGRVVAVTGASRGIGAALVRTLARDGARVLGVDVPGAETALRAVTAAAGGEALAVDVTARDAGERIAQAARDRLGGLQGIVHNAGITRDRKLVNLPAGDWRAVVEVNLRAPQRITEALLDAGVLGAGGRVVFVSSVSGIAGNAGQTNYATAKAGVLGLVEALWPALAPRGVTVNAVAPGFVETDMTRAVPLGLREAARRLSTLRQGGLPGDVAEAAAWMLDPASAAVTGTTLRVCGQALVGA